MIQKLQHKPNLQAISSLSCEVVHNAVMKTLKYSDTCTVELLVFAFLSPHLTQDNF